MNLLSFLEFIYAPNSKPSLIGLSYTFGNTLILSLSLFLTINLGNYFKKTTTNNLCTPERNGTF